MKIGVLFHAHPSNAQWSHTRFLRAVGKELVQRGDTFVAFVPTASGGAPSRWEGIDVVPIPFRFEGRNSRLAELQYPRRVAQELDRSFDAVVQTADLGGAALFSRARALGVLGVDWFQGVAPLFLTHVRRDSLRGKLGLAAERFWLPRFEARHARRADLILAPSRRNAEHLQRYYGIPSSKVRVLPNGFDPVPPVTPQERADARRALGLEEGRSYASFVGIDWYRKGLDVLRESVRLLQERGVPWTILNVGNVQGKGPLEIGYGWCDGEAKRRVLAASDAFVFPTRYEGSPLPVPEAAGLGLPIVTTPDASVDQGKPGEDFLEVPTGDAKALADAMEWIARHPAQAREMAERCHRTFLAWTWEEEALALRRFLTEGKAALSRADAKAGP